MSELEIDTTLVYSLLADRHPDLMHLPIHFVAAGRSAAYWGTNSLQNWQANPKNSSSNISPGWVGWQWVGTLTI